MRRSVAGGSLALRIVALLLAQVGEVKRQAFLGGVAAGRALAGIWDAHAPAAARVRRVPPGEPATAPAEAFALLNSNLADHQTGVASAWPSRYARAPIGNCNLLGLLS
jgi:hypothetical protein